MNFASKHEALRYAVKCQVDRRNLSDAEIMNAREDLKRCNSGSNKHTKDADVSTLKDESELFQQSRDKTQRQRFVDNHATEEQKEEIRKGEKSYNKAYNEIKEPTVRAEKSSSSR